MASLTKSQKELVEKNHNLIYQIAFEKKLYIDEYYDILAIGLCKAAQAYENDKGEFSTVAYQCMSNELNSYWRHLNRKTAVPLDMIDSYDRNISRDDNENKNISFDNMADDNLTEEIVVDKIMSKIFLDSLTKKEQDILTYIRYGLTNYAIAKHINCSRQMVDYYYHKIIKKFVDFQKVS